MGRYIGTVSGFRKEMKDKYVYREGEDKCDMTKLNTIVEITDIVDYNTGLPVNVICDCYLESKTISRVEGMMFLGNRIVFDAVNTNGKLQRLSNFCGNQVSYLSFIDKNHNLIQGAVMDVPGTYSFCSYCKHFDTRKEMCKSSCLSNKNLLV